MKTNQKQNIYHGSPSWESSTIGRDLILDFTPPNGSSVATTIAYRFELKVKEAMLVSINGSDQIWLDVNDELELEGSIWSVKLLDNTGVFRYIAYL
jgi:hypothetical protein